MSNATQYLNKSELCKLLHISPHTAQKELQRAMNDHSGAVIKIGRCLRIDFNRFVEWNNSKLTKDNNSCNSYNGRSATENINNKEAEDIERKWEKEILKTSPKETTNITLTTTKESAASALQLKRILNI